MDRRCRPNAFHAQRLGCRAGEKAYLGALTSGDQTISACTCGSFETRILRTANDPYEAGS